MANLNAWRRTEKLQKDATLCWSEVAAGKTCFNHFTYTIVCNMRFLISSNNVTYSLTDFFALLCFVLLCFTLFYFIETLPDKSEKNDFCALQVLYIQVIVYVLIYLCI